MTEKQKMLSHKLYDVNDKELAAERMRCKMLCQRYNSLPIEDTEARNSLIRRIIGKTGASIHLEPYFWCDYGWNIEVGENFYSNHNLIILDACKVVFGDNVLIGPSCGFYTATHPIDYQRRNKGLELGREITVGSNVWFGACVQVMPGVSIGSNTVIGGGSVVTRDIPADSVAAGNPCRVIRSITDEDRKRDYGG